jgi:hypothetical protein
MTAMAAYSIVCAGWMFKETLLDVLLPFGEHLAYWRRLCGLDAEEAWEAIPTKLLKWDQDPPSPCEKANDIVRLAGPLMDTLGSVSLRIVQLCESRTTAEAVVALQGLLLSLGRGLRMEVRTDTSRAGPVIQAMADCMHETKRCVEVSQSSACIAKPRIRHQCFRSQHNAVAFGAGSVRTSETR